MRNYSAKDVDTYIVDSAPESQEVMRELRKIIKSTVPEAEERISWGVPFYRYKGLLGGFAVFKSHISFGLAYVFDDETREVLEKKGYSTGKKTVQIRFDQKVPEVEVKQILKTQVIANENNS